MINAKNFHVNELKGNFPKKGDSIKPGQYYKMNTHLGGISSRYFENNSKLVYNADKERMRVNAVLMPTNANSLESRFKNIEEYNNEIKVVLSSHIGYPVLSKRESMLIRVISVLLVLLGVFFLLVSISFFLLTNYTYIAIGALGPASGALCASTYIYYKLRTSLIQ